MNLALNVACNSNIYSEFDAKSKSATFIRFNIMGDICMPLKFGQNLKNVDFWVSFTMVTVFFGPNQLVLVQIIKARYRAAMLESEPGYSGLVRGCYVSTGTRGTY